MSGVQRLQPKARCAFGAEVVAVALRREAFLLQLRPGAERGFELAWIVLAIVTGQRQVVDVESPLGDVLPNAQRGKLISRETRPLRRARHGAGADLRRGEAVRVMQRDVPRALPTLRKAADDNALVVDIEALLDSRDRLEHVHLAGPVPAGAIDAAETIELDLSLVGHGRIAGRPRPQK